MTWPTSSFGRRSANAPQPFEIERARQRRIRDATAAPPGVPASSRANPLERGHVAHRQRIPQAVGDPGRQFQVGAVLRAAPSAADRFESHAQVLLQLGEEHVGANRLGDEVDAAGAPGGFPDIPERARAHGDDRRAAVALDA